MEKARKRDTWPEMPASSQFLKVLRSLRPIVEIAGVSLPQVSMPPTMAMSQSVDVSVHVKSACLKA